MALRLARVHRVAEATRHLARFVIFGSFVTGKREPNDVDILLIMPDAFDASQLRGEAPLLFDYGAAQAHFGASVFWLRRLAAWPNEAAAVEFWQVRARWWLEGHRRSHAGGGIMIENDQELAAPRSSESAISRLR